MLKPVLMIVGGAGALGAGYMAFKASSDDAPAPGPGDPKAPGGPGGPAPDGAGPDTASSPGPGGPQDPAGAQQEQRPPLQGHQVGRHTIVVEDGTPVVYETATQNPIGMLDEAGNFMPIQMDADGNYVPAPVDGGDPTGDMALPPEGGTEAPPQGEAGPTSAEQTALYARLAAELFAEPIATGDAQSGATQLSGAPALGAEAQLDPALTDQAQLDPALSGGGQAQLDPLSGQAQLDPSLGGQAQLDPALGGQAQLDPLSGQKQLEPAV